MRKNVSLGIEFINDKILFVLLEKRKAKFQLKCIKEMTKLSELRVPKIRSYLPSLRVVTAIPKNQIVVESITLGIHLSDYEVEQEVMKTVNENADNDVFFDFSVKGVNKFNDQEIDIDVYYAKSEAVDKILNPIKDVKLTANVVEVKENMRLLGRDFLKNHQIGEVDSQFLVALGCALRGFV